jgi:hypothetical protein
VIERGLRGKRGRLVSDGLEPASLPAELGIPAEDEQQLLLGVRLAVLIILSGLDGYPLQ